MLRNLTLCTLPLCVLLGLAFLMSSAIGCSKARTPTVQVTEETGTVIDIRESVVGGIYIGSTSTYHLAVEVETGQGKAIRIFCENNGFRMLPMAKVGDRVSYSYWKDSSGVLHLQTFGVDFAHRQEQQKKK
jgi:hypothetical protein